MVQSAHASHLHAISDVTTTEAWEALSTNSAAQLVDVRTHAEWVFSGLADLDTLNKQTVTLSWKFYPNFDSNPKFLEQLAHAVPDKQTPLYFICKTGGRSFDAASAAQTAGYTQCFNITNGFEGDPNSANQRGKVSGWKAANLPWNQA